MSVRPGDRPAADGVEQARPQSKRSRLRRRDLQRYGTALGAAAAVVVAVLVNVLAARHYRRWDWTETGLYTLSGLTKHTLSALGEPVKITVLLSTDDPLALTLRHLLESYRAQSSQLHVHFVDPDRNPAELIAVQQQYGIVTGKTEDGQLITDATIVVARGKHHHFITAPELFAVEQGHAERARPRLEEALTGAIQQVRSGDAPRICFTTGHGEPSLDQGGAEGLMPMASRLGKLNFEAAPLAPLAQIAGKDPVSYCRVVVVAAPQQPLGRAEVARLKSYSNSGGNLLILSGPVPDEAEKGYVRIGLGPLLAMGGIRQRHDFVFERDPARRSAQGFGETLIARPLEHPVTKGLLTLGGGGGVVLAVSSSLAAVPASAVAPSALLTTSDQAFGMTDFFAWAANPSEPEPQADDVRGPLSLAFAAELPKRAAAGAHGPRLVVVSSASAAYGANWQQEQLQGTAIFVESAISWLASEPFVLDIPAKPARPLGLRLSEQVLASAARELVGYLPLGVALLGLGIHLQRRRSEGRSRGRHAAGRGR